MREGVTSTVRLADGTQVWADVWQEDVVLSTAQAWAVNVDGPAADGPAVTRNQHGQGVAWYVPTKLGAEGIGAVVDAALHAAGIDAPEIPEGVELLHRRRDDAEWAVAINHGDAAVELHLDGQPLVGNPPTGGTLRLGAGDVAVVRTDTA